MRSEQTPAESLEDADDLAGAETYAVVAEGLSKRFVMKRKTEPRGPNDIWALRNVDFDVVAGEAVGIVGLNGAGKSTLLEIIAGTRLPTEGRVRVRGRVAALLQLGAGFHPEFTGRENVFLTASIQGVSKSAVEARFDEIAAFADIGHFLEQSVKTYSSGMYARLAFAVATAYEPNILIVDEILAVGDAAFQQKCVTRIERMRESGMTLLFVSHSVDRVNALCGRALLLDRGRKVFFGESARATDLYLQAIRTESAPAPVRAASSGPAAKRSSAERINRQTQGIERYGSGEVKIEGVELERRDGIPCEEFAYQDEVVLSVEYRSSIETTDLNVSFLVRDDTGVNLLGTMTWDEGIHLPHLKPSETGLVKFRFVNRLRTGRFGVCVALTRINEEDPRKPILYDQIDGVASFVSQWDSDRPIHYKFDAQIEIQVGPVETRTRSEPENE